jgi:ribonucleoside-diphosphate reductase alpha chain
MINENALFERNAPQSLENQVAIPGTLTVIRRNGTITPYVDSKIAVAVSKAFLATEGGHAATSTRMHEIVTRLTGEITATFRRRLPSGGTIHIEDIQDQVELSLMRSGEQKVARAYVLYREERRKLREQKRAAQPQFAKSSLQVVLENGARTSLDLDAMWVTVNEACENLQFVDAARVMQDAERNLFDGVPVKEVNKSLVMSARSRVEEEPNYSYVAARLLMDSLRSEALSFLRLETQHTFEAMNQYYPLYFGRYIQKGIEAELLSPELEKFDLVKLSQALQGSRDAQFNYLGLQTLYDRYFIHSDGQRFELPQAFFMRVAMGLSLNEANRNERAIEFYNLLSSFDFMSSTPTLFNSGTLRPQLSSCYLTTIPDDLEGIYNSIRDNALLSKYAGGLGNDWTPVRGMSAYIKGTNGKSQGVIPFMKVANDTAVAVNQGGKRKGATCAYLETWHIDIEEYLELRKNTGDERRRCHDMNTANWVPDLFMKRVFAEGEWTLFSPDETTDLHDLYGAAFETAYAGYEAKAKKGQIKTFKTISALGLWRKMLGMLFETGHPWITFKDPCNLRSPQQHVGVVHSSNLCTEITLNTSADEIAVCNLGSINLLQHINEKGLDKTKLEKTIRTAIRMLDNVIDINYYAVPQAKNSNAKHRPIGLGIMGFQDALYQLHIPYASQTAVDFADISMEAVSYFAIEASTELAAERGSYASFKGSLWSKGVLPIDSIEAVQETRGKYLEQDRSQTLDWDTLRKQVKKGMRNSNVMAIAPTATIANITGVTQSIEPTYQNLYVKSNLSGEFTVINPFMVRDLKALNLWDAVMVDDLKYFDGRLTSIDRVPEQLKKLYATAFEIEPRWLIEAASRRQKWIDQAQSLNLYMAEPSGKKLDLLYRMAWLRGLKTTYYLRSMGATSTEKSTLNKSTLNAVNVTKNTAANTEDFAAAPKVCSILEPDCEACQ